MPRAKTKEELQQMATEQYKKLQTLLEQTDPKIIETDFNFEDRDKNISDVLMHLYAWHQLMLQYIKNNQENTQDKPISFLPEPYNWRNYGDMNINIQKKYAAIPYEEAKQKLDNSHQEIMQSIGQFSNKELFEKGVFAWTNSTTLGSYFVSCTSSHYDWAQKKIKKHIKSK